MFIYTYTLYLFLPSIVLLLSHSGRIRETADAGNSNTLHHTAIQCNTWQQDERSSNCNTLQHTATHCNTLQHPATELERRQLQHTATYCNTLHCAAIQYNTLQQNETVSSCNTMQTLQHTVRHCNTLQQNERGCNGSIRAPHCSLSFGICVCVFVWERECV